MPRPKKPKSIQCADILDFIDRANPQILELITKLIERKLVRIDEVKTRDSQG